MQLLSLIIAILFILLNCPNVFAAESEDTVIKVAFPQAKGINEIYEDGTYGGCTYDWLMEIAKHTGWKYEFITEGDTSKQINYIRNGECDIMGGMYYREAYEKDYNYSKYIMGSNYSLLIYRQDNLEIKGYDYSTFNGKKIGVFKRATAKSSD